MASPITGALEVYRDRVRPEWVDANHHMNMGYYMVVFDLATDAFFRHVGLGAPYRAAHGMTTFCLEAHLTYNREVRENAPLRFTTRLLAHDARRLHYFHEMYHASEGYVAATNELMTLHVSQATRRAAEMAPELRERLAAIQAAHDALPRPPEVGRVMGLTAGPPRR